MKIAILYSLLIYQLFQHCNATDCIPLSEIEAGNENATLQVTRGSDVDIISREYYCNRPNNNYYVLLHKNHRTGNLVVALRQERYRFRITNIQLRDAGIYCVYKQCAPDQQETQCCTKLIVLPEVEIIFPDPVPSNAQQAGICQAKSWPRVTNDLHVETGDGCAITRGPVMRNDNYTAAVYFTLNYVNSSCQQITCRNAYDTKTSSINTIPPIEPIGPVTTPPPSGCSNNPDNSSTPDKISCPICECNCTCDGCTTASGGVLGIYRITLWIIVLSLTLLSVTLSNIVS